jgi:tetratricopeptide (TPR) repeat protein
MTRAGPFVVTIALGLSLAAGPRQALGAQGTASPRPAARSAPDTRLTEATRALSAGDATRAFELATAYLKQHPGAAAARVLLARVHIERGELDDAYQQLDRALRAEPRNVDALYYFGIVTSELAVKSLDAVVERSPTSARAKQIAAETLEAEDRRTEAEAAWEAALAANPNLLEALLGLAKLKRIRLDCEGAMALYTRAEAITPTFDAAYGLGTCELRQQRLDVARQRFQEAIARDPRAAVAHVGLGSTLLGLGQSAEAIASLQRALALEPAMTEAWYLLGRAQQAAGNAAAAKEAFARAEQLRTGIVKER